MKWRLDSGQIEVLDEAMADILRRKTPAEKIQMIGAAHRTARRLIAAGVRHQHPDWDDARVEAEVLRRLTRGANPQTIGKADRKSTCEISPESCEFAARRSTGNTSAILHDNSAYGKSGTRS